ncbi:hornerin-like [Centruroides vittatus]|uniref:hornerin-like n=1 Tax=Centruroides vittatus TaxID=120091 RepID=UPI00350EF83A
MIVVLHTLLLMQLTYARTYESSNSIAVKKSAVKYAGPMVYSNLPPPVVYFPTMPKIPKNMIGSSESGPSRPVEYIPLPYQDLPVLIYQSKHHPPVHVVHNNKHGSYSSSQDSNKGYLSTSGKDTSTQEGGRGFGKFSNNYDDYEQGAASESYNQIATYSQLPSSYEGYRPTAGHAQTSESYSRLPSGYQSQDTRFNSAYHDEYSPTAEDFSQSSASTYSSYSKPYKGQYTRNKLSFQHQSPYDSHITSNSIKNLIKSVSQPSPVPYQADESYMKPIVSYPPETLQIYKGSNYGYDSRGHHSVYQPKPIFLTSPSTSNAVYIPRPPPHSTPGDDDDGGRYGSNRDMGNFPSLSMPAPHIIYTGHPPIHVFPQPIIVKEAPKPSDSALEEEQGEYAQASEGHSVSYGGYKDPSSDGYNYKGNSYSNENNNGYNSASSSYHDNRQPSDTNTAYSEDNDHGSSSDDNSLPSRPSYSSNNSPSSGGKFYGSGNSNKGTYTYTRYPPSYEYGLTSGYGDGSNIFGSGGFHFGGYEGLKLRPSGGIMGRLTALGSSLFVRRPFSLSSMFSNYRPSTYYVPSSYHTSGSSISSSYKPMENSGYTDHITSASQNTESYNGVNSDENEEIPYPKVNYKVPPTSSTASPYHHKPPIIIYQGIRPPVYVYSQTAQEKNDEGTSASLTETHKDSTAQITYENEESLPNYHQPTFSQKESIQQSEYDSNQQQNSYEASPVSPEDFQSDSEIQNYDTNAVERADHPDKSEEPEQPQDLTDRSGWVPINFPEDQKEESVEGRVEAEILVS